MEQALEQALARFDLHAPRAFAQTNAACLWRVRGADGSDRVLKLYKCGHAGNEAGGAALMEAWHRAGANVVQMHAWADDAWVMDWIDGHPLGDTARGGGLSEADQTLSRVARDLHKTALPHVPDLPDLDSWFAGLFALEYAADCPAELRADMTRATHLAEHLLKASDKRPLHGDLHHDNVLVTPDGGAFVIDAKGVMGDPAYELANAMRNPKGCGAAIRDPKRQAARCDLFARALDVDPARLAHWAAAKCALSIAWSTKGALASTPEADLLAGLLRLADSTRNQVCTGTLGDT